ncbi:Elongation of fatty acids protein 2 [Hypoxylon texense]
MRSNRRAPAKPCAERIASGSKVVDSSASGDWIYWPYSGVGTAPARITGMDSTITELQGHWFVYNVESSVANQLAAVAKSCWERASQLLSEGYRRVLYLRPILPVNHVMQVGQPFAASQHLDGGRQKEPVAICATRDDYAEIEFNESYSQQYTDITEFAADEWEWKGVYSSMPDNSFEGVGFECRWLKII